MDKKLLETIGVNEVGMLAKLLSAASYEDVWAELKKRGAGSIEVCAIMAETERAIARVREVESRFAYGFPPCFARGDFIYELTEGIRSVGLEVYSCHLMVAEAYPEYVLESVPYMKEIHARTGISQFVISCMFNHAEMVEQYLPCIEEAAKQLAEDGIDLCYHNHDMDSTLLENGKTALDMVLEGAPHAKVQYDIGWAWYGGQDAASFIQAHADRIASVHLKDLKADARERTDYGRFAAIGSGAVDTKAALDATEACNLKPGRLIIDQDGSDLDMYDEISKGLAFLSKC